MDDGREIIAEAEEELSAGQDGAQKDLNPQDAPQAEDGRKTAGEDETETGEEAEVKKNPVKTEGKDPVKTEESQGAQGTQNPEAKAPACLNEEQRKAFAAMDASGKKILADIYKSMNADYTRKSMETARARREIEEAFKDIDGCFGDIKQAGDYLRSSLAFERAFREDPAASILNLMAQAGLTPEDLAAYRPDPVKGAQRAILNEINSLKKQLGQKSSAPAERTDFSEDERNSFLEQLAQAKAENGTLKYPHIKEVAPYIGMIMKRDGHEDLDRAYKEALYCLPATRDELLQNQKAKLTAEIKKNAELGKAKKAAAVNMPEPFREGARAPKTGSLIDLIAETEEELSAN